MSLAHHERYSRADGGSFPPIVRSIWPKESVMRSLSGARLYNQSPSEP